MSNHANKSQKEKLNDIPELGIDIARSFHEQFAQNQNHHQVLFVQVLAVLVTVLVGFGYVYIRTKVPTEPIPATMIGTMKPKATFSLSTTARQKIATPGVTSVKNTERPCPSCQPCPQVKESQTETNITVGTLYAFLALAAILLSFGVALISNMALGFRRDQMVAANIRVLSLVMKQPTSSPDKVTGTGDVQDFFPEGFNPVDNTTWFSWMPEFHKIFLITLVIVKIVLALSVFKHPQFGRAWYEENCDSFISIMFWTVVVSLIADFLVPTWYWWKWRGTARNAFPRLRSN
jgi:hypothetical protein